MVTAQSLGRYLQPMQIEQLKAAVKKFVADGARANIKRWAQTAEVTSARAGLLLCGDLEIAKKIVSKVPRPGRLSLVKMA